MLWPGVLIRAAAGNRPRTHPSVHIWRHFAVLTINVAVSLFWDHLFLGREGCDIWKSWKFKVMTLRPLFEIGSMAGLMKLFR